MVKKGLPLILCLLLTLVSCNKKPNTNTGETGNPDAKAPSVSTMFAKYDWVLGVADVGNFGKTAAQLKEMGADFTYLKFGNKVTVVEEKQNGDKLIYKFKKPSGDEYWADSAALAKKYVVINSTDVPTYSEPETSYGLKVKLQPGMLGFLLDESNGWFKVEIWAYSMESRKWAGGTYFIQSGFTNDLNTAKQAYLYYQAVRKDIRDSDLAKAKELTKEAIDVGNTDIINVIESYMMDLEGR